MRRIDSLEVIDNELFLDMSKLDILAVLFSFFVVVCQLDVLIVHVEQRFSSQINNIEVGAFEIVEQNGI